MSEQKSRIEKAVDAYRSGKTDKVVLNLDTESEDEEDEITKALRENAEEEEAKKKPATEQTASQKKREAKKRASAKKKEAVKQESAKITLPNINWTEEYKEHFKEIYSDDNEAAVIFGINTLGCLRSLFNYIKHIFTFIPEKEGDSMNVVFSILHIYNGDVDDKIVPLTKVLYKTNPELYTKNIMLYSPPNLQDYLDLPWIPETFLTNEKIALNVIYNLNPKFNDSMLKFSYIRFYDVVQWLIKTAGTLQVQIGTENINPEKCRKSIIDVQIAAMTLYYTMKSYKFQHLADIESLEYVEYISNGMPRARHFINTDNSDIRWDYKFTEEEFLATINKIASGLKGKKKDNYLTEERKNILAEGSTKSMEKQRLEALASLEAEPIATPKAKPKKKTSVAPIAASAPEIEEEEEVKPVVMARMKHPALRARQLADYTGMSYRDLVKHQYETEKEVPPEDSLEYIQEGHRLKQALSAKESDEFKNYLSVQKEVKDIGGQKGLAFERVVLVNQICYLEEGRIIDLFSGTKTLCSKNPKFRGKNVRIGEKTVPLGDSTIVDISTPTCDYEIKYYVGFGNLSKNDLRVPIDKFTNNGFFEYYFRIIDGRVKLYNIWSTTLNDWVNSDFDKDIKFIVAHNTGFILYDFTNDLTYCASGASDKLKLTRKTKLGLDLYILKPKDIKYEIVNELEYIDGKPKTLVVVPNERISQCFFKKIGG